jgi:hypothetical protein
MCCLIVNPNLIEVELPSTRYERSTFYGIDWKAYFDYAAHEERIAEKGEAATLRSENGRTRSLPAERSCGRLSESGHLSGGHSATATSNQLPSRRTQWRMT